MRPAHSADSGKPARSTCYRGALLWRGPGAPSPRAAGRSGTRWCSLLSTMFPLLTCYTRPRTSSTACWAGLFSAWGTPFSH
eukprot:5491036-Lingulodinium_polyedra.AAC.1